MLGDSEKEAIDYNISGKNSTSNALVQSSQYEGGPEYPFVAGLLIAIAIISLVAALIAAAALQTQGSTALAVSVLASGIIQMAVLSGLGQVIVYLNRITYKLESKSS